MTFIEQLQIPNLCVPEATGNRQNPKSSGNDEDILPKKLRKADLTDDIILNHLDQYNVPGDAPIFVSYGGGTNSTAMLIAMWLKGIKPEAIFFADTGGERPETYEFIKMFSTWLTERGFPEITVVKYIQKKLRPRTMLIAKRINIQFKSFEFGYTDLILTVFQNFRQYIKYTTLEEECLLLNGLPSRAFGLGSCSAKWKIRETQKACLSILKKKNYTGLVKMIIGYHAGEKSRLIDRSGKLREIKNEKVLVSDFPLIRWNINQDNCQALLDWAGLKVSKSACFFCPNAKPHEVIELREKYPDLYQRACDIEKNFRGDGSGSVVGLGRDWKWSEIDSLPEYKRNTLNYRTRKCSCTDE